LGYGFGLRKTMGTNDSVTKLERIKAKRATIFNVKLLCGAGRKYIKQLGALLRMNSKFNLRGNTFCLNGTNKRRCTTNPQVRNFILI
jgi:hypothetical protein